METSSNKSIFKWVIPFVILVNAWSFLGGWVTLFARTWIWLAFGVLALIFVAPGFFRTKVFFVLVMYSVVVILNRLSGDDYYGTWPYVIADILSLLFYGGTCYYLFNGCNEIVKKRTLYLVLFVIIYTSIATFLANRAFPDIVREMVVFSNQGVDSSLYYRMGVCEYAMPHAIPILIAPLLFWLKDGKNKKTINKIFLIGVLLLLLLLVWTSGATTPLLVGLFALVVSLIVNPNYSMKRNIRVLILAAIISFPLTFDSVQLDIIHGLESILPSENSNYGKLKNFEDNIVYGTEDAGDITARRDLYVESITAFGNNFLLGTNDKSIIGGHSIILDRLAMIGIIGVIPYLLFLYYVFKDIYYNTRRQRRIYILIGALCFLAIITLKNMLGTWMYAAAFVMLPLMVNYDFNKEKTIK